MHRLHAVRTWTDKKGRKIQAALVRIDGDKIVIATGEKEMTVPVRNLSDQDRQFLEQSLVPEWPTEEQIASAPLRNVGPPAGFPHRNTGFPSHEEIMAEQRRLMEESKRRMEAMRQESERQMRELEERTEHSLIDFEATEPPQMTSIPIPYPTPSRPHRPDEFSSGDTPPGLGYTPSVPTAPAYESAAEEYEEYFECSGCKKRVPASIQAGDNCPHCGAFFEYAEHVDGTVEYAPAAAWIPRFLGIALIALLVGGVKAMIGGWFRG